MLNRREMWRFLTYTSNFMSKPFPTKDQNCLKSIAISQKPKGLKTSDLPCWSCTYLGEYPPPPYLRENPPPPRAHPCHSFHFPQTLTALPNRFVLCCCMAIAMIKKQNKCTVWYYISYCSRCLGEVEVLRSIFYCYNDTLLPPPRANIWKVCHLKLGN